MPRPIIVANKERFRMKAITIIQPWATLLAIGAKQNETSGWATKHRGPVAIHAGKKTDKAACRREPIQIALAAHGYAEQNLPTGALVAIGRFCSDCRQSMETRPDGYELDDGILISSPEADFGDFGPGRFAWSMTNVNQLPDPIPAKGQLGLWNFDMPEQIRGNV